MTDDEVLKRADEKRILIENVEEKNQYGWPPATPINLVHHPDLEAD